MKKIYLITVIAITFIVFTGASCGKKTTTNNSANSTKSTMTEQAAKAIAENMCVKSGETLGAGTFNENSKTWWFDAKLNPPKAGCNPACVVNEQTKTAEINWRCTGAIEPTPTATEASNYDKQCGWVDKSDVIITVKFADGVTKDTAYEAGFFTDSITFNAHVARQLCNYRTGFSFTELKGKGAAQMGVRGYTDSVRRQIVGDPVSVTFDASGKPSLGTNIEVTIKD